MQTNIFKLLQYKVNDVGKARELLKGREEEDQTKKSVVSMNKACYACLKQLV